MEANVEQFPVGGIFRHTIALPGCFFLRYALHFAVL
jgi:hypothetical protein